LLSGSLNFAILHLGWHPKVGDFRFATKAYHPKKCSAHLFPGRQGLTECHESQTPFNLLGQTTIVSRKP